MIKTIIISILILSATIFPQNQFDQSNIDSLILPQPDNLFWQKINNFKFTDFAKSAGMEVFFRVHFLVDSSGIVSDIRYFIFPSDDNYTKFINSTFTEKISDIIKSTNWQPAYYRGKPINARVRIPILFMFNRDSEWIKKEFNKYKGPYFLEINEPIIIRGTQKEIKTSIIR